MKKNCSKFGGSHEPPFGKYCKFWNYCSVCDCRHVPPLGLNCTSVIKMAEAKPVVKDFPSRDDPKYLEFLEKSFLEKSS